MVRFNLAMQTLSTINPNTLLEWAASLPGITSRQLERLKRLVPELTTDELRSLKTSLEQNQKEREAGQAVLARLAARQKEYFVDQNRENRESKESIERAKSDQRAEQSLLNL